MKLYQNIWNHSAMLSLNYSLRKTPTKMFMTHFNFNALHSSLEKRPEWQGSHASYTARLKDILWVNRQLQRIQYLLRNNQLSRLSYPHLRSIINQLLFLCKHATNARSYHDSIQFDSAAALGEISKMMKMTFSESSNRTYESIEQEEEDSFEFIEFPAYFQICNSWNTPFDEEVLRLYHHSYMRLFLERNILKCISVFDTLREGQSNQIIEEIIHSSISGIIKSTSHLKQKMDREELLNPYEMVIYLKFIRSYFLSKQENFEKNKHAIILSYYILQSPKQLEESSVHCQNLTYAIYLLQQLQGTKGGLVLLTYEWICQRCRLMDSTQKSDHFLDYLTHFASHQDKLTCIKIDIWLSLLNFEMPLELKVFNINPLVLKIISGIKDISFRYWRCKYVFWLMDSILNKFPNNPLPYLEKICSCLTSIQFRPNDKIIPIIIFLKELTHKFSQISLITSIHESVASWLNSIPIETLKAQNSQDLCELLTLATSHPTLQRIYTPYLLRLLEMSMGHFLWTQLTRVYYYGLRFGVQQHSEEAKWNMEYVRRYILNQYATMGLRRRQIPQDSYFYKIIGITTPEKFYQNYFKM